MSVTTNGTDYAYANPIPGGVGTNEPGEVNESAVVSSGTQAAVLNPDTSAVSQGTESEGELENAPEDSAAPPADNEQNLPGGDIVNPEVAQPAGATDTGVLTSDADQGFAPTNP
jgi:hypothetical protein